jgi:hypothetical protein
VMSLERDRSQHVLTVDVLMQSHRARNSFHQLSFADRGTFVPSLRRTFFVRLRRKAQMIPVHSGSQSVS